MEAVVLAAGEGTRLRPLTEDKPKGMVEVAGKPILTHCFEQLAELGADKLVVVVGYMKEQIMDHYGDEFEGIPVTYAHQREQQGLAHALLTVEEHVDGDFMLMLGDNVFDANLGDVVSRQREDRADAAFLVEEVPEDEASRLFAQPIPKLPVPNPLYSRRREFHQNDPDHRRNRPEEYLHIPRATLEQGTHRGR